MKALSLVLLSSALFTVSLFGQATSPEEIVKKTIPKDQRTPPESTAPNTVTPEPVPTTAVAPNPPAITNQPVPVAPPVRVKTPAEIQEIERKTIEFQIARAHEGSASAQYDLGMRYLSGNGVDRKSTRLNSSHSR